MKYKFSNVEQAFIDESGIDLFSTKIPYIIVNNFPKLGLLNSMNFLEWVLENPEGVISLPTGKTPEYFIKWTNLFLDNWGDKKTMKILDRYHLDTSRKPDLSGLQFVQIDEFYPISSAQHNSFYHYVMEMYIGGFGFDTKRALLMNSDTIPLPNGKHFTEVFPDLDVDLSLRHRSCNSRLECLQRDAIFMIDEWCSKFEDAIREKGGIGYFLGGIGPDGHIAFNMRGADEFSTTRLTSTNFETQAVAAGDLGGIEVSRKRKIITIGLQTITYNPDAVAIIMAAGEAKAQIVKESLETEQTNFYPASVLAKLPNSRFYLTEGAAMRLHDSLQKYYFDSEWDIKKTEKSVVEFCEGINKYGNKISVDELRQDPYCRHIPNLDKNTIPSIMSRVNEKIERGMKMEKDQVFLHTGPHHDDIMLGIFPYISQHLSEPSNKFHFSVLTSGFNAVTNKFVINLLEETKNFIAIDKIQMIKYSNFFDEGYKLKRDKDVYHYIRSIVAKNDTEVLRGTCHRLVRSLIEVYEITNSKELLNTIDSVIELLKNSFDGEKNPPQIQKLKGMIREFEEDLVWAHFGIPGTNVEHLRLGFYKGDIFTEQPEKKRDVLPILEQFKRINPNVISLAFDPEGSGPDTHYKVLQAIAEGLRMWSEEKDLSDIRIWGYRNVWYRFDIEEANIIIPVSLNEITSMDQIFSNSYASQVDAPFPSYEMDGKFSYLSQKIWDEQMVSVQYLLGKDYFYQNENPKLRSCHGLIFLKEMTVEEFLTHARSLEKSTEGQIED